ncbi:MAG: PadR family transcriptional regulator, regulatory protein PadR [Actinomycetota bacterium]
MSSERLKGHLEPLLLGVLKRKPAHGYAVIAGLRERSGGEFDLPEGTVYPALHRLEKQGLVDSHWEVVDGRRRRVYSITGAGANVLAEQRAEFDVFAASVRMVLS